MPPRTDCGGMTVVSWYTRSSIPISHRPPCAATHRFENPVATSGAPTTPGRASPARLATRESNAPSSSTSDRTSFQGGVRRAAATRTPSSTTVARNGGSGYSAGWSRMVEAMPRIRLCSASRRSSHGPAAARNSAALPYRSRCMDQRVGYERDEDRLRGHARAVPSDRPAGLGRGGRGRRIHRRVHGQRALPSVDPRPGPVGLRVGLHGGPGPADDPPVRDGGHHPGLPLPPRGHRPCRGHAWAPCTPAGSISAWVPGRH